MIAEHVARWTNRQKDQYRLCGLLERVAERLPLFETHTYHDAVISLGETLESAHNYEEGELFPLLEASSSQIGLVLLTFRAHHADDREEAGRLARLMTKVLEGETGEAIRELKARLELFASGLRRHVQFEEAICRALFASARSSDHGPPTPRRLVS